VAGPGQIDSKVIPGEGMTVYLRGVVDVRLTGLLEETLQGARNYPPVTVDLSGVVSLDGPIVDLLAEASSSLPQGLLVVGAIGSKANAFESTQVEHLRAG